MQKLSLTIFLIIFFNYPSCLAQETLSQQHNLTSLRQVEISKIIELTETKICNPHWLKTKAWQSFVKTLQTPEVLAMSSLEFKAFFNIKVKTLPFSHYYLGIQNPSNSSNSSEELPHFEWKALDEATAYLQVRSFVSDAATMFKITQEIQAKSFQNLIIDLRNNTGGTADAAVVIGQFLTNEAIDVGVYLPRPWFMAHENYPSKEDIKQFSFLKELTGQGFHNMVAQGDGFRMVVPPHDRPIFPGKVFVLINSITASTCEPLVALIKERKMATIVGSRTNGAMLMGSYFSVSEDLKLFLPVADFMMADGVRLDQKGVEPDVAIPSEKALEYTLEKLIP